MIKYTNCIRCNVPLKKDEVELCSLCTLRHDEWYHEEEARREAEYNFEDASFGEQKD